MSAIVTSAFSGFALYTTVCFIVSLPPHFAVGCVQEGGGEGTMMFPAGG